VLPAPAYISIPLSFHLITLRLGGGQLENDKEILERERARQTTINCKFGHFKIPNFNWFEFKSTEE
jgi:hypothetical protein